MNTVEEVSLNNKSESEGSIQLTALAQGSVIAITLQLIEVVLAYTAQLLLARWMGKTEYGFYEYAITWSLLLAVPAGLGLPRAVMRLVSEYRVKQEWGLLRGLMLGSWEMTMVAGLCVSGISTAVIMLIDHHHSFSYAPILLIGVWLIPCQALLPLQENMARGMGNLVLAYTPTKIVWPILVILGGVFFCYEHTAPTGISMIWVALGTLTITIVVQAQLVWLRFENKIMPDLEATPSAVYILWPWLKIALPLLLFQVFRELLVQTDILMLGSFKGVATVGIYSAASKTSAWVSFVLNAVNIAVAPTFAILHVQGKRTELQKILSTATVWIFVSSSIIALILIIFAKPILGTFGSEFVEAHWALKILILGQFVNALSGSVGILLSMTGYQNTLMVASICTALVNLVLNAVAIPLWGTVGAALTTAFTFSLWKVWLMVVVIRNLKVNPTIFSNFKSTSSN